MLKRVIALAVALLVPSVAAVAQEPQQAKAPAAAKKAEDAKPPEPPGKPINVRLEFTITDQGAGAETNKKTVSMIVADRQMGNVRSRANVRVEGMWRDLIINVDARPSLLDENRLKLEFGLDYQPQSVATGKPPDSQGPQAMAAITERMSVFLQSGKPLTVSQGVDPTSDRRVTVEVTATIVK